jgi:iron complex outermembrane receptor protein
VVASYADGKIKNGTIPCLDLNNDGKPDSVTTPPTLLQMQNDVGAANIDTCAVSLAANANPKFSASVQSEYSLPVNDAMDAYVRGLYTFQGNSKNDPVNFIDDVKDYGLLNLYTGVRSNEGDWDVSLYAKNVLNTFRVLTRTNGTLTTGRLSGNNYYGVTVTQPREFGITARYAFGSR